jgi:hypothetical protein
VDEFLARPDVQFVSEVEDLDDADVDDDEFEEDDEELDEAVDELVEEIYEKTRQRCLDRGETPSPLMYEALHGIVAAMALRVGLETELEGSPMRVTMDKLKDLIETIPPIEISAEIEDALKQIFRVNDPTRNSASQIAGKTPETVKP